MNDPKTVRQRVAAALQENPTLQPIIATEPKILEVLQMAARQTNQAERWKAYSILKQVTEKYVGWYAENEELKGSDCYQVVIEALDLVLPAPEVERITNDDQLRQAMLQDLRDAILRTCPEAKTIAEDIVLE